MLKRFVSVQQSVNSGKRLIDSLVVNVTKSIVHCIGKDNWAERAVASCDPRLAPYELNDAISAPTYFPIELLLNLQNETSELKDLVKEIFGSRLLLSDVSGIAVAETNINHDLNLLKDRASGLLRKICAKLNLEVEYRAEKGDTLYSIIHKTGLYGAKAGIFGGYEAAASLLAPHVKVWRARTGQSFTLDQNKVLRRGDLLFFPTIVLVQGKQIVDNQVSACKLVFASRVAIEEMIENRKNQIVKSPEHLHTASCKREIRA